MIHNNASGIFQGKAMGVDESNADDPGASFEDNYSKDNLTNVLQPVGFDDKVMGGQRSSFFLDGKMPGIGGAQEYSQRLRFLTKQSGGFKMSEKMNGSNMSGFFGNSEDPLKKVSSMTKNNGSSNKSLITGLVNGSKRDLSGILGGAKNSTPKFDGSMLGGKKLGTSNIDMNSMFSASNTKNKTENVIKDFFKTTSNNNDFMKKFSASNKFDVNNFIGTGVGSRALPGLDMKHEFNVQNKVSANAGFDMNLTKNNALNKINSAIGMNNVNNMFKTGAQNLSGQKSKFNDYFKSNINTDPSKMFERTGVDINRMMGGLGNPEKTSKKRLRQQRGLSMFGDYDGDKLANILDCDPLDPTKQGEQHKLTSYMGDKDLVAVGETGVSTTQPSGQPSVYGDDDKGVEPVYGEPYKMNGVSSKDSLHFMGLMPYYEPDDEQFYGDVAGDTDMYRGDTSGAGNVGADYTGGVGGTDGMRSNNAGFDQPSEEYDTTDFNFDGKSFSFSTTNEAEAEGVKSNASKSTADSAGLTDLDAQISRITGYMEDPNLKDRERTRYSAVLKDLYAQRRLEEDARAKRGKESAKNINEYLFKTEELGFKKEQFEYDKLDRAQDRVLKHQKFSRDQKMDERKFKLHEDQFEVDKLDRAQDRVLKRQKFARDQKMDERKFKLQQEQLRADRQKGQMALWENKLKAGSNMLGSLVGGTEKPKDYGDVTGVSKMGGSNLAKGTVNVIGGQGSAGLSSNASALTGMSPGSGAYAIAESVGESGYNASFGQKVMESVGESGQGADYNAKVGESLGGQTVDEVKEQQAMQRRMQQQMQDGMMQSAQQPQKPQFEPRPQPQPQIQRQMPRPQPQPQMREPAQRPQFQQRASYGAPRIDWDTVSPNQAAQFDPEYAEYLKESNATYRRGPYKKGER